MAVLHVPSPPPPGFRGMDNPASEPSNDVAMIALSRPSDVAPVRLPSWDQPTPGMKVGAGRGGLPPRDGEDRFHWAAPAMSLR